MPINLPKDGPPGTTEQSPQREGPLENRPRGYLPAKDDPEVVATRWEKIFMTPGA
jgi:hypothetical protein